MKSIIVSSPHSLCQNLTYRNCDTLAYLAASRLTNLLNLSYKANYYPSNKYRSEIDLNRDVARNTEYRINLSKDMRNSFLLIDVHSCEPFGYDVKADIIILDDYPGTNYGKSLYETIRSKGVSVVYLLGDTINDIVETARHQFNIPAILIEYTENINIDVIDRTNMAILEWINKSFS